MSHFTRMRTRIADGELLTRCLREAGYSIELNAEITGYQGQRRSVDVAVRLPKGYDIGFVRASDGNYELVADWFGVRDVAGGQIATEMGDRVKELEDEIRRETEELERKMRHEYAVESALEQLERQGFQVAEKVVEEDGTVRLMARRWT